MALNRGRIWGMSSSIDQVPTAHSVGAFRTLLKHCHAYFIDAVTPSVFASVRYDICRGIGMRLGSVPVIACAAALLATVNVADASTVVYKATFDAKLGSFEFLPFIGLNRAIDSATGSEVEFNPNDFTLSALGLSNLTGGLDVGESRSAELTVHFDGTNYTIDCAPTISGFGYCATGQSDRLFEISIQNNVLNAFKSNNVIEQRMTLGPNGGGFSHEDDGVFGGVFGNIHWEGYFTRYSYSYSNVKLLIAPSPIPLPATALMFIPAIGALVCLRRRSRRPRSA